MFGEKQLHEIQYQDLKDFLLAEREEGVRLDYKGDWSPSIIETACAFANTYGGYILYGVKEVEGENRTRPDSQDIPGIDFSKGSPLDSTRSRILSNTRPAIPLTLHPIFLEDSTDRAVILIQVEESVDSPHEVLLPSTTKRIPKRHVDQTLPASLDEIEQMIQRRDNLLQRSQIPVSVEFFRGKFTRQGEPEDYGRQFREVPPIAGVLVRPHRINSMSFKFNSTLDDQVQMLALRSHVGDDLRPRPTPFGLVMEDFHRDYSETPTVRLEVHKTGLVRGACALHTNTEEGVNSDDSSVRRHWINFGEVVSSICSVVRFAAGAYAQRKPGVEMEVSFGLSGCTGHNTKISAIRGFRSYEGQIPGSDFYQEPVEQYAIQVKTNLETERPEEEDLLNIIRELSRIFQMSVPDERLRLYV